MRILVCASEAPLPPMNGFRLQVSPVCAELAKSHEVFVLAYRWPEQVGEAPDGVELETIELPAPSVARRGLTWLTTSRPLGAVITTPPMAAAARELLARREFDVLHIAGWSLSGVANQIPAIPTVLTALDANYINYQAKGELGSRLRRWAYSREAERIVRFEREAYRDFSSVVVVTEEDAAALKALDSEVSLQVVPNGVDAEEFSPRADVEPEPGLIVFTGAMQWRPNVAAAAFLAREVFPLVRERRPDARLALVGRRPAAEVRALATLEGVVVTGTVPDVRDWLWRAQVFACPMVTGTGIKNKLLEALACEVPCVATPLACQGIGVASGRDLLLGSTAEEVAEGIVRLLEDRALGASLSAAGRDYVVEHHSWQAVARAYERLLQAAIADSTRA